MSLITFAPRLVPGIYKHTQCRNNIYPKSKVQRFPVPDDFIFWNKTYPKYEPPEYSATEINEKNWADAFLNPKKPAPKWNEVDGDVNRVSFHGPYSIQNGVPLNPFGRTGIVGRGLLGRWGPNHAADPVVTRWKRDPQNRIIKHEKTKKNVLQMVAIQRKDNNMWAIPGGMVDPGENVNATLKREFIEEAMMAQIKNFKEIIEQFFEQGMEIYKGYVDDFRNTDNAWIETIAINFHDRDGTKIGNLPLSAGDDALHVRWMDIDKEMKLHANHALFIEETAARLDAHW